MNARAYNHTTSYYEVGNKGNVYYYEPFATDTNPGVYYKVFFTRLVSTNGIAINIVGAVNLDNNSSTITDADKEFFKNEIYTLVGKPVNGFECQDMGWQYLGNTDNNTIQIAEAIASAQNSGYEFKSVYYKEGYFVYGCADTKQFYDKLPS